MTISQKGLNYTEAAPCASPFTHCDCSLKNKSSHRTGRITAEFSLPVDGSAANCVRGESDMTQRK